MKAKLTGVVALALLLVMVFAVAAAAAVPQSVIDDIIADAQDGTIDGDWTTAEIDAALQLIQNDPVYQQYSDIGGVLEDYVASVQAPGAVEGELAFTGGAVLLVLAAGAGLVGSGALLRRRRA